MTPFNFEKPGKYQNVCKPIDNLYAFAPEKPGIFNGLLTYRPSFVYAIIGYDVKYQTFLLIRQFKCNSCGHVNEKPDTITFLNQPRTYFTF
jgi:hypothetical protein